MTSTTKAQDTPSAEYQTLQDAYDFLNAELFDGKLRQVMITLHRHKNAKGYFSNDRFKMRSSEETTHELALNPDIFPTRSDKEIVSTLAHEMVHVWQQDHGKAPRRCYHDKQWAAKMKEIGLQPTSTGLPGGKETGQKVTHYIIDGGAYANAWTRLEKQGFQIQWNSFTSPKKKKERESKVKYTCPECESNAWAKPETNLICGDCECPMPAE